jgi:hypothetical protein
VVGQEETTTIGKKNESLASIPKTIFDRTTTRIEIGGRRSLPSVSTPSR